MMPLFARTWPCRKLIVLVPEGTPISGLTDKKPFVEAFTTVTLADSAVASGGRSQLPTRRSRRFSVAASDGPLGSVGFRESISRQGGSVKNAMPAVGV